MKSGIVISENAYLYERLEDINQSHGYSGIADEIFMGWGVGILEEGAGFVKAVTHYGYQGYIRKEHLRLCVSSELEDRDYRKNTFYINRAIADVMNMPGVKGKILCSLSRGSFVTVLQTEMDNGYLKVRLAGGSTGYIPKTALSLRLDDDAYLYLQETKGYFLCQKRIHEIPADILRSRIADQALDYLGTQYRWGCKSGTGLDCSGMTFMSYQMCGILIYRDAKIISGYPLQKIPMEKMGKGDLLFFPGHVAMYLENGKYIHTTGHASAFECVINSLRECDGSYRKDLAEQLLYIGSVF